MDVLTEEPFDEKRFLPALAKVVADGFPELNGRAFATSGITITKDNIPTLPLAMTALLHGEANPSTRQPSETFQLTDLICIEFWLEPVRYKNHNGAETPFWSYYPYEVIRDVLLNALSRWTGPGGEILAYRRMTISVDPFAVTLTFHFTASATWCAQSNARGEKFEIGFLLKPPPSCCIEDLCPPCDPCP